MGMLGAQLVQRRQLESRFCSTLARLVPEMDDPVLGRAALGVLLLEAQPFRQPREDLVIRPCATNGIDRLTHRDDQRLPVGHRQILALEHRRCGEHDVRVARHGCPPDLIDDDRLGPAQCAHQPPQVLMVMERVAAGPVDEARVRVGAGLSVKLVLAARVHQQVSDTRNRDGSLHRVLALRHGGELEVHRRVADAVLGRVANTEAAARQADLTQHGGKDNSHPDRLLAMIGTLDRPGHRDHRACARHAPCQGAQGPGVDPADPGGPVRILGLAVRLAHQVAAEGFPSRAIAVQERLIVQPLGQQCIR